MSKDNRPEELSSEEWLDELFKKPHLAEEILADESAVAAAGLTHPSDLEFEKIMREALSEDWSAEDMALESELPVPEFDESPDLSTVEPFKDDEFRDTFGEGDILDQIFSDEPMPEGNASDRVVTDPALAETKMHQAIPSTPAEEEEAPAEPEKKPAEKGRPKRKGKYGLFGIPHLVVTAIWLFIILAIGVTVGRMVWLCAQDVLAFGREPISATITIEEGDDIKVIAQKLKDAGLIKYTGLFEQYAKISDAKEDIRPGTYTFNQDVEDAELIVYDYMALVSAMSPTIGQVVVEDLRIPEGYTCAQIFQLLEDNKVCTVAELEKYAMEGELDEYWFLEGLDRSDRYCLEGYLFPNTYDFYENDDPERVLEKMLNAFDANFTDVMKAQLENMDGYTIREVIIIASMIEKESANVVESFAISAVIYNRLNNASKYPYLNIDATIVYALGGKSDLTAEDLKIDHPYNTYKYPGLTPGPISNPSQNSIAAALDPDSDYAGYYFYALDPAANAHHFSKTYEEHQKFLQSLEDGE